MAFLRGNRRTSTCAWLGAGIIAAVLPVNATMASPLAEAVPASAMAAFHWTAAEAPLPRNALTVDPGHGAEIDAISCASAQTCVAVGSYTDSSSRQEGLILRKAGGKWTSAEAPLPAGAARNPNVRLVSVSCPAATMCLIAGRYALANGAADAGLLVISSGGSWKAREAPVPANAYTGTSYSTAVNLTSAYCPNARTCVVAGTYSDKKIISQSLLLTYSTGSWTVVEAPVSSADLVSISCVSGTSCAAVGTVPDPYNSAFTLGVVVAGIGKTWAAGRAPLTGTPPLTSESDLQSVACTEEDCVAAGDFMPAGGTTPDGMLIMSGTGIHWSATQRQMPQSGFAGPGPVYRVSCPDKSTCVFSALYYDAASQLVGAVMRKASAWSTTLLDPPVKSYSIARMPAIACGSATSCAVAGEYVSGYPASYRPMIQQGSGTSWTGPLAPLPANGRNTRQAQLTDISCPLATECIAVGDYSYNSTGEGLLLTGTG